jgi:hypothetical protein
MALASDTNGAVKKHALFLGCSWTFGEGLECTSSFPFLFEQLNKDYKSYNYGYSGFGPHQIALLFDEGINTINQTTIKEPKGFALYTFMFDHLDRVYEGSKYLRWAKNYNIPEIYIENGSLIVRPTPFWKKIVADFFNNVGLAQMLGIQFGFPHTEEFYKRFADIISYTAKKYWEINPDGDFYVGIHSGENYNLEWIPYLDPRIKVLKADTPVDYAQNVDKYKIKHDGHPTKELNAFYVKEITRLMREQP